jgi:hypothetical protein
MKGNKMTEWEFDIYFEIVDLMDEYMEYIIENCHGDRIICDGDGLLVAAEERYLYDEFRDFYISKL